MIEERTRGATGPKQTLLQRDQMIGRLKELTARHDEIVTAIEELKRHLAELG